MRALNAKQLLFVQLHLAALAAGKPNATQSYLDAGFACSRNSARAASTRLLADQRVQELLAPAKESAEAARRELVRGIEISRDRIRLEMARIGFLDPRKLFHTDGTLKGVKELDADTAAAVASVEVEERFEGDDDGVTVRTRKYKFWDKCKALQMLADTEAGVWAEDAKAKGSTVTVAVTTAVATRLSLSPEDVATVDRILERASVLDRVDVYTSAFQKAAAREAQSPSELPAPPG